MPWKETDPMFERMKFVEAHRNGLYTMTELCERFGVSRRIGYKWLARFEEGGASALTDVSRRPHHSPLKTPADVEAMLVKAKRAHPDWGPWKLVSTLRSRYPDRRWPSPSTAGGILARHGLVEHRQPRRRHRHPGSSPLQATGPNDVWTADFKGEFRLGNGQYCFPLTVEDAASRFLLACDGFAAPQLRPTLQSFERLFRIYGLPRAIRTDNGAPFVTQAIHGLSRLNVYWMRLGIAHQRTRPGCPQDNPRHERMHRTLKRRATIPPEPNHLLQQRRFDAFRQSYNEERPHQSLDQTPPAKHYRASTRPLPERLPKPDYPLHYEVRLVRPCGRFKFRCREIFLSSALAGEHIALEEIDDRIWSVYFYDTLIARLNEQTCTLTP